MQHIQREKKKERRKHLPDITVSHHLPSINYLRRQVFFFYLQNKKGIIILEGSCPTNRCVSYTPQVGKGVCLYKMGGKAQLRAGPFLSLF